AIGGGHLVGGGVGDGFVGQSCDEGENETTDESGEQSDASAEQGTAREAADDAVGCAKRQADECGGERKKQQRAGVISRGLLLEVLRALGSAGCGWIGHDDKTNDGRQAFFRWIFFEVARD